MGCKCRRKRGRHAVWSDEVLENGGQPISGQFLCQENLCLQIECSKNLCHSNEVNRSLTKLIRKHLQRVFQLKNYKKASKFLVLKRCIYDRSIFFQHSKNFFLLYSTYLVAIFQINYCLSKALWKWGQKCTVSEHLVRINDFSCKIIHMICTECISNEKSLLSTIRYFVINLYYAWYSANFKRSLSLIPHKLFALASIINSYS